MSSKSCGNNTWADEAIGGGISANYNDALYPITVTNKGAIQERWALVFTSASAFRVIGETTVSYQLLAQQVRIMHQLTL